MRTSVTSSIRVACGTSGCAEEFSRVSCAQRSVPASRVTREVKFRSEVFAAGENTAVKLMRHSRSRLRTSAVVEGCSPSEVRKPEVFWREESLFISGRGPRLRWANKAPEPTPRLEVIRSFVRRAKLSGNSRGVAHL
jgi:hypothetical protein